MSQLSTTRLLEQLTSGKFSDFNQTTHNHFQQNPTDITSAQKAIKVIASFAYKSNIPADMMEIFVSSISTCIDVVLNSEPSDLLLKEQFGHLVHVINRFVLQNIITIIPSLSEVFLNIYNRLTEKIVVDSLCYNMYATLWNMSTKWSTGLQDGDQKRIVILTQYQSIKFYLAGHTSDKFSKDKMIDKTKSVTSTVLISPDMSDLTFDLMIEQVSHILENSLMDNEAVHKWDIWCLILISCIKHRKHKISDMIQWSCKLFGSVIYVREIDFINSIATSKSEIPKLDDIGQSSLPSLLSVLEILLSHNTNLSSIQLVGICNNVLLLTKFVTPSTAIISFRILATLTGHLTSCFKTDLSLTSIILSGVADQVKVLSWLVAGQDDRQVRSCYNNLTTSSYNMTVQLVNTKMFSEARQMLQVSIDTCLSNKHLATPTNVRPRYKLMADIHLKLGDYKECLSSLMMSLIASLAVESEEKVKDRMAEVGKLWTYVKREWAKNCPDQNVHEVTIVKLSQDLSETMTKLGLGMELVVRLARWEVGWYRVQSHSNTGCDLTQSRVNVAGHLLGVSDDLSWDQGMVLLEQTWVFWLGGNPEDLETGLKCVEKAEMLLENNPLGQGMSKFWKYSCLHQQLMFKGREAVSRSQEMKNVERKEREGMNEEEKEVEVIPTYPGLEMTTHHQLMDLLDGALECWTKSQLEPTDWLSGRTILDFIMSVGWQNERLGQSGARAFSLVVELARIFGEVEYLVIGGVELIRLGEKVDLKEIVTTGREIEMKKPNNVVGCQTGLGLIYSAMDGSVDLAKELVVAMIDSPVVKQNTLTFHLLEGEVKLVASQLRQRPGEWVRPDGDLLEQSGPVELALEAWKLSVTCCKWVEEDLSTPFKQDPSLLWLSPRSTALQLRCLLHLADLFSIISAPRELRCYLKQALQLSQSHCLPLQSATILVSLARASLLCDDELTATIQLGGVEFILGETGSRQAKEMTAKQDKDMIIKLPGQEDLSMSPSLPRTQPTSPVFVSHPPACSCRSCHLPLLHLTILRSTFVQGMLCHMAGERDMTSKWFNLGMTVVVPLLEKTRKWKSEWELKRILVECLLNRVECLGQESRWEECNYVIKQGEMYLSTFPKRILETCPGLLVSWLELKIYVEAGVTEKKKRLELREINLSNMMAEVKISEELTPTVDRKLTPTVDKKVSRTKGAPNKRIIPSLGVGNAVHLAKKLEDSLSQSLSPLELKTRLKPHKPKLICSLELFNLNLVKHVVPKITLTEDTPRKFFKSKGPTASLSTPAEKIDIRQLDMKSTKGKQSTKQKEKKGSIDNVYNIFQDCSTVTPANASTRRTTRTTTKESSKKVQCPSSVSKPPKMGSLSDTSEVQPTRTSSRKKTGLKRLL